MTHTTSNLKILEVFSQSFVWRKEHGSLNDLFGDKFTAIRHKISPNGRRWEPTNNSQMKEPNSTSATMQIVEFLSKLLAAGYSYRSAISQMLGGASKYRFRLSSERNVLDTLHPTVRLVERNQDSERLLTTSWAVFNWMKTRQRQNCTRTQIRWDFSSQQGIRLCRFSLEKRKD